MILRLAVPLSFCIFAIGCGNGEPQSVSNAAAQSESRNPWFLVCGNPKDPYPALLWNGLIGIRLGREGTARGVDGKVLPMFWCDGYEHQGEEKIIPLPNPFDVTFTVNGSKLVNPTAYAQVLDMRNGKLTTRFQYGRQKFEVQSETVCSPDSAEVAQRWTLRPGHDCAISLRAQIASGSLPHADGTFAIEERNYQFLVRNRSKIFDGDRGVDSDTSNNLVETELSVKGDSEAVVTFERSIRIGSDKSSSAPAQFQTIADASSRAWNKKWQTDIVIDGPLEDQQAVRSMLFYLRSAISPNSPMSIAPFGLSDETYNGHIFWDADMWVFPALAIIDPDSARAISSYRLDRERLQNRRTLDWLFEVWKPSNNVVDKSCDIAFPWESSVSGAEVAPGDSKQEVHISGDVAWSLNLAKALGLVGGDVDEITHEITLLYWHLGTLLSPRTFTLEDVMSPDEFHIGDTDLYTNALAQWCHDRVTKNKGVSEFPPITYILPKDDISLINYAGDRLRGYKQAAGVLAIYPLQNPIAESQARIMMERFADKTTPNGPAMSDSVHATIWSRLGETNKAYETWQKGWKDFMKGPLMLFGEKRKTGTTYFTTGAAGCIQTVLFGFLGLRIDDPAPAKMNASLPQRKYYIPLADRRHLTFSPNLPKLWKSVRFNNFTVCGQRYSLAVDHKMAVLTPAWGKQRVVWTAAQDDEGHIRKSTNPTQEKP